MRRREFITVLASACASWSLAGTAQQQSRMRRIGVLMGLKEDDPQTKRYLAAFQEALGPLGWVRELGPLPISTACGRVLRNC
jgi:hypothetical protein